MPGPFTVPVAASVPLETGAADNSAIGTTLQDFVNWTCGPDISQKPEFLVNGEVDKVTFYKGPTQIDANRRARVVLTYDGQLNPTAETWTLYGEDGTTVMKTVTFTHTWVGVDNTKTEMVTT